MNRIPIDGLIRYLEVRGNGTWRDFDHAVKESIPSARTSYEIADRLSALGFLEFDWQSHAWQFCRPTFVQTTRSLAQIDGPAGCSFWRVFTASARRARKICEELQVFYDVEDVVVRTSWVELQFARYTCFAPRDALDAAYDVGAAVVTRQDLERMLYVLPPISVAATYWYDDGHSAEDWLKGAESCSFFNPEVGEWERRSFDGKAGMWKIEVGQTSYYHVTRNGPAQAVVAHRVPRDLGHWFAKARRGLAYLEQSPEALEVHLEPPLRDLPLVFDRWLSLWGATRSILQFKPRVLRFDGIDARRANIISSRLGLAVKSLSGSTF